MPTPTDQNQFTKDLLRLATEVRDIRLLAGAGPFNVAQQNAIRVLHLEVRELLDEIR